MVGKVTVRREVAEAIEMVRSDSQDNGADFIRVTASGFEWGGFLGPINSLPLDTLIRALYIGYEVEKSVEESLDELLAHLDAERRNLYNHADTREKYRFAEEQVRRALEIVLPHLPESVKSTKGGCEL